MAEHTRTCPECGGTMNFRLGEFQCQQCPHTMVAPKEPELPGSSGYSGAKTHTSGLGKPGTSGSLGYTPGSSTSGGAYGYGYTHAGDAVHHESKLGGSQYDPGAKYRNKPPPAPGPPGSIGTKPGPSLYAPDDFYGGGGKAAGKSDGTVSDGLTTEKNIYFGITCLIALVFVGLLFVGGSMGGMLWLGFVGLVCGAIGLAVNYWVLFNTEIWAKYVFGGCAAISLIGSLASLFGPAGELAGLQAADPTGALAGYYTPFVIIDLLRSIWFVSIMFRDAQRIQAGVY